MITMIRIPERSRVRPTRALCLRHQPPTTPKSSGAAKFVPDRLTSVRDRGIALTGFTSRRFLPSCAFKGSIVARSGRERKTKHESKFLPHHFHVVIAIPTLLAPEATKE